MTIEIGDRCAAREAGPFKGLQPHESAGVLRMVGRTEHSDVVESDECELLSVDKDGTGWISPGDQHVCKHCGCTYFVPDP